MRKPTFWFPTWSDTNQAVQLQKMARVLKFLVLKVEAALKALISFAVTEYAYAKRWFSYDAAHIMSNFSTQLVEL